MASVCILWWADGYDVAGPTLLGRAALGLVKLQSGYIGWGEIGALAGIAAGLAIPLGLLVWRVGIGGQVVAAAWVFPAIAAPLYARTLPDPVQCPPVLRCSIGGADLRWPLLALGIQIATIVPFLLWWAVSCLKGGRRPYAASVAVASAWIAVSAWILITRGIAWTYDL